MELAANALIALVVFAVASNNGDTEESRVVAEDPSSEPTAKNYGSARGNAQHSGNYRWIRGGFEQLDTRESRSVAWRREWESNSRFLIIPLKAAE
jgi:hypothetical protein